MDDSIQETVDVTRNDKALGVGLPTTTTSHFVNVLFQYTQMMLYK